MEKFQTLTAVAVPLEVANCDTDRIIPARFMKCVTFDGLGEYAFYDVRFDKDGKPTGHPLDDPRFKGANILLSGTNFGCGSSREHAPQALYRFGIRAVIAESFAEIFFGNCTTLGIPCVCASASDIQVLAKEIERNPQLEVTIDVTAGKVFFEDQEIAVSLPGTAHEALTSGKWDPIAELLENKDAVHARITALGFA